MTNPQGPPPVDQTVWSYPAQVPPPAGTAGPVPSPETPPPSPKGSALRRIRLRDPLSIILIVVIVVAVSAAGLLAAELYARHVANKVVASATECVIQDATSVSFGAKPLLLQALTDDYSDISISTAGNQIRDAKGMKADIRIDDIKLAETASSQGTIGELDATINWSSEGIKQTVQNTIPLLGGFVTGVSTNPTDGTIVLQGALGSVTTRPTVVNKGVGLQVLSLTGLGFTLPREAVQPALDAFTTQLTDNYPLGITADEVRVTDSGVIARFSTRNAEIPIGEADPCFAGL